MRLRAAILLAIASSWVLVPADAAARILEPYAASDIQTIAPGVTHESGTAAASAGIQQVNIFRVAPDASDVHFETSLPYDRASARERVTDQAWRQSGEGQRVIAAVNGNLWSTWGELTVGNRAYSPIGLSIADGELVTAPIGAMPAFGVDSGGRPVIGMPTQAVELALASSGAVLPVTEVNRRRDPGELVLYTPRFDTHTRTDASGVELIVETGGAPLTPSGTIEGTVVSVRADLGNAPIGSTQMILSGAGAPGERLRAITPGEVVSIATSIDEPWVDVEEAVGGAEILVNDGRPNTYTWRRPDAVLKPHPRTAIGLRADGGVIAVAVDGRSSVSRGLTNAEMGELLISLGATDAINLDGGGSTTMAIRRPGDVEVSVVNRPSDGVERSVSASLLLISATPTGALSDVIISTGVANVYVDETHQLVAKGRDARYNGIMLDQSRASWSATGDSAQVTSDGILHATQVGPVDLGLVYGELSTTRTINVLRDGAPPIISPPSARFAADSRAGRTSMGLVVSWAATDVAGSVASMQLQQRVDTGSWQSVTLPTPLTTTVRRTATFGRRYQFRVRATDDSGNRAGWTYGPIYRIDSIEAPSAVVKPTGTWTVKLAQKAIGGQYGRSDMRLGPQPSAAGRFTGVQAALVGVRATRSGFATIYDDGVNVGTFDLYRSTKQLRSLIYTTRIADADQPTQQRLLEITNEGRASRPFMDLDALLVLVAEQPVV